MDSELLTWELPIGAARLAGENSVWSRCGELDLVNSQLPPPPPPAVLAWHRPPPGADHSRRGGTWWSTPLKFTTDRRHRQAVPSNRSTSATPAPGDPILSLVTTVEQDGSTDMSGSGGDQDLPTADLRACSCQAGFMLTVEHRAL